MRRRWFSVTAAVTVLLTGVGAIPAWALTGVVGQPPVSGPEVRGFEPPPLPWEPGHRGVDLAVAVGTEVVAPADGVVSFAGMIAGRPVLVISHGEVRSTLEPVEATVMVGERVTRGQAVGRLAAGHACAASACLHWGLRRGENYLDPRTLLAGDTSVRLLPADAAAGVAARAARRAALSALGALVESSPGRLARPLDARVTSAFGMRLHPIFREWRLHAGVDLSAPCGTPFRAAADGVVTHVGYDASGGWRLVIDHGGGLSTTYLHAQGYGVARSQRVSRGQVVGWVGTTGWSTGCHLHFGVKSGTSPVDPEGFW